MEINVGILIEWLVTSLEPTDVHYVQAKYKGDDVLVVVAYGEDAREVFQVLSDNEKAALEDLFNTSEVGEA